VKIHEFGMMKQPYRGVYSILERCNFDLNYYIQHKDISFLKDINKLISFFYKIVYGVKLLHDIGYIHLDIKVKNYLIKIETDKKISRKLTDFGFLKRIGSLNPLAATQLYSDPRLVTDYITDIKSDKMMDIFSLGIVFIEIMTALNDDKYFYMCPFLKQNNPEKRLMRELYYTNKYPTNNFTNDSIKIRKFYDILPSEYAERLYNINIKMIADINTRYKNVNDIITDLSNLHTEINKH
jgi:serine/threonine protein kinase